MSTTTVLVAKHIPDPFRNESKNVGVIVSNGRRLEARFLGEDELGKLHLNSVPKTIVTDRQVYRQWVEYFRQCLSDPERYTHIGPGGIDIASPSHMGSLLSTHERGQYFLSGGVSLMEELTESNLTTALDHLYSRLVEAPEVERDDLAEAIDRIIVRRHLESAPAFKRKVTAKGTKFHFDYGVLNARLEPVHVYQRLSTYERSIEKEVAAGAFKLSEAARVGIHSRTAVIRCTADHERSIKGHLDIIRDYVGDIINLESAEDERRLFAEVAMPSTLPE